MKFAALPLACCVYLFTLAGLYASPSHSADNDFRLSVYTGRDIALANRKEPKITDGTVLAEISAIRDNAFSLYLIAGNCEKLLCHVNLVTSAIKRPERIVIENSEKNKSQEFSPFRYGFSENFIKRIKLFKLSQQCLADKQLAKTDIVQLPFDLYQCLGGKDQNFLINVSSELKTGIKKTILSGSSGKAVVLLEIPLEKFSTTQGENLLVKRNIIPAEELAKAKAAALDFIIYALRSPGVRKMTHANRKAVEGFTTLLELEESEQYRKLTSLKVEEDYQVILERIIQDEKTRQEIKSELPKNLQRFLQSKKTSRNSAVATTGVTHALFSIEADEFTYVKNQKENSDNLTAQVRLIRELQSVERPALGMEYEMQGKDILNIRKVINGVATEFVQNPERYYKMVIASSNITTADVEGFAIGSAVSQETRSPHTIDVTLEYCEPMTQYKCMLEVITGAVHNFEAQKDMVEVLQCWAEATVVEVKSSAAVKLPVMDKKEPQGDKIKFVTPKAKANTFIPLREMMRLYNNCIDSKIKDNMIQFNYWKIDYGSITQIDGAQWYVNNQKSANNNLQGNFGIPIQNMMTSDFLKIFEPNFVAKTAYENPALPVAEYWGEAQNLSNILWKKLEKTNAIQEMAIVDQFTLRGIIAHFFMSQIILLPSKNDHITAYRTLPYETAHLLLKYYPKVVELLLSNKVQNDVQKIYDESEKELTEAKYERLKYNRKKIIRNNEFIALAKNELKLYWRNTFNPAFTVNGKNFKHYGNDVAYGEWGVFLSPYSRVGLHASPLELHQGGLGLLLETRRAEITSSFLIVGGSVRPELHENSMRKPYRNFLETIKILQTPSFAF